MKIIDKGKVKSEALTNRWARLFVFGKDEEERALVEMSYEKNACPGLCFRAQLGGDVFAEISACVGKHSVALSIWSV